MTCNQKLLAQFPWTDELVKYVELGIPVRNLSAILEKFTKASNNVVFDTTTTACRLETKDGQRKNFWVEDKIITQNKIKTIFYQGAAPGLHLIPLAIRHSETQFYLQDHDITYYHDRRVFQLQNVHHFSSAPESVDLLIRDYLSQHAQFYQPVTSTYILEKLNTGGAGTLGVPLQGHIIMPPCRKNTSNELKIFYKTNASTYTVPLKIVNQINNLSKRLNKIQLPEATTCRNCMPMLSEVEEQLMGNNGRLLLPKLPTVQQTLINRPLAATHFEPLFTNDSDLDHALVKACRTAAKARILSHVQGKKVVELGPRASDQYYFANSHIGHHFCAPELTSYDRHKQPVVDRPEYAMTTCHCLGQHCTHHKADTAIAVDVYLDKPAVTKLLERNHRLVWAFSWLPTGNHPLFNCKVERAGGRLKVTTTDSADKLYDDADPLIVIADFPHTIVSWVGPYVIVSIENGVVHQTKPNIYPDYMTVVPDVEHSNLIALTEHVDKLIMDSRTDEPKRYGDMLGRAAALLNVSISYADVVLLLAFQSRADIVTARNSRLAAIDAQHRLGKATLSDAKIPTAIRNMNEVLQGANHPLYTMFITMVYEPVIQGYKTGKKKIVTGLKFLDSILEDYAVGNSCLAIISQQVRNVIATVLWLIEEEEPKHPHQFEEVGQTYPEVDLPPQCLNPTIPHDDGAWPEPTPINLVQGLLPPVVGVPPPSVADQRPINTVKATVNKRIGHDTPPPKPERCQRLGAHLNVIADEILSQHPTGIRPMDFQCGCSGSHSGNAPACGARGKRCKHTDNSATGDSPTINYNTSMLSLKPSSSNRESSATSSEVEIFTTALSSEDISPPLRQSSMESKECKLSVPILTQPRSSSSKLHLEQIGPLKQTTQPGTHTLAPSTSTCSMTSTDECSMCPNTKKSFSKCASEPISRPVGHTKMESNTHFMEDGSPEMSIPLWAIHSCTSPSTKPSQRSADPPSCNESKETTPSYVELAQKLASPSIESTDSRSNPSGEIVYLKWNSAALISLQYATRAAMKLGKCADSHGKLLADFLTQMRATAKSSGLWYSERRYNASNFAMIVSQCLANSLTTIPDVEALLHMFISNLSSVKGFWNTMILAAQTSHKEVEKILMKNLGLAFQIKCTANDILIHWNQVPLLTIGFLEPLASHQPN